MRVQFLGQVDCARTVQAMRDFTQARTPTTPDELWLCEHSAVYTQGVAGKSEHVLNPGAIAVLPTNRGGQVTYHGPGQVVAYPLVDLKRLGIYVKEYVYRIEHAVIQVLQGFGVTGHRVVGAPGVYVRLNDPFGHSVLQGPRYPLELKMSRLEAACGGVMQGAKHSDTRRYREHLQRGSASIQAASNSASSAPMGINPFDDLGKIAALGVKVSRHCTYYGVALNVNMDLSPFSGIRPCGYEGLQTVDLAKIGVTTDWLTVAQRLGDKLALHLS